MIDEGLLLEEGLVTLETLLGAASVQPQEVRGKVNLEEMVLKVLLTREVFATQFTRLEPILASSNDCGVVVIVRANLAEEGVLCG